MVVVVCAADVPPLVMIENGGEQRDPIERNPLLAPAQPTFRRLLNRAD